MIFVVVAIPKTTSLFWFRVVTATKLKTNSTYVIWFWFLVFSQKLMQQKKGHNSNLEACLKILGLPGFKTKIKVLTIDLKALRSKIYFCWIKTDVPVVCIFITPFLKSISLFSRSFFGKFLTLCMVSIQERFVIKNGLWWRAYWIYNNSLFT